jgi:hypothetical protein
MVQPDVCVWRSTADESREVRNVIDPVFEAQEF